MYSTVKIDIYNYSINMITRRSVLELYDNSFHYVNMIYRTKTSLDNDILMFM